ncbi:MAG: hypothetical protein ACPGXK_01995, partial [Phycisphaerae bacterium]
SFLPDDPTPRRANRSLRELTITGLYVYDAAGLIAVRAIRDRRSPALPDRSGAASRSTGDAVHR